MYLNPDLWKWYGILRYEEIRDQEDCSDFYSAATDAVSALIELDKAIKPLEGEDDG